MTESTNPLHLTVIFSKGERARFLSHLDLISTLEYGMRRAKLHVDLSQGFNPRPRMSLASPLPLGYLGEGEIMEIWLRDALSCDEVVRRLDAALPGDIQIRSAHEITDGNKTAASRLYAALYRVELAAPVYDLADRAAKFLARASVDSEELREGITKRRDIRPYVIALDVDSPSTMHIHVHLDNQGTTRPEPILAAMGVAIDGLRVTRERIDLRGDGD